MECFQIFKFFAYRKKLNRFLRNGPDRKCCATAGVSIHFRQHHTRNVKQIIEAFCHTDCFLTCHCISNKKNFMRHDGIFDPTQFLHQFLVYVQPSCSVDKDGIGFFLLCSLESILDYIQWILICTGRVA